MTLAHAVLQFALVAGLLTLTPGIDTALVLRQALTQRRGVALVTALGIGLGCLVWGVAAAVGISALVTASATAFRVVKLAGAAYLLALGVQLLWQALRRRSVAHSAGGPSTTGLRAAFAKGLLTNLLNPKVGVFYVAVLPQFLPPGYPPVAVGALLAGVHFAEGMVWFAVVVLAAGRLRRVLEGPRAGRIIDGVTGTVLIGFGVRLAAETLTA